MNKAVVESEKSGMVALHSPQQELFCQLFTGDNDMFGNGTQAYIEAYDIDTTKRNAYDSARSSASALLARPIILRRIGYLLDSKLGFNDTFVDKQLAFLITQSADYRTKLAAIREYNALKGRIKHKLEIDVTNKSLPELDSEYEKLQQEIALAEQILQDRQSEEHIPAGMPLLTQEQKEAMASVKASFKPAQEHATTT